MKNEQIIKSWNKIEPDSAAQERMQTAILSKSSSGTKSNQVISMNKSLHWKRIASLAACLMLVVAALTASSNINWFGRGILTQTVENNTLHFYKNKAPARGSLDLGFAVTSRNLTADENNILFKNFNTTSAYGLFDASDKRLLHVEATVNGAKILLAAPGVPISCTVIEAESKTSVINGIPVAAGYFITNQNSAGERNIIYFAFFALEGISVYAELGGPNADSDDLREKIGILIDELTQNGAPAFAQIKA